MGRSFMAIIMLRRFFALLLFVAPASVLPYPADAVYIPARDYFSTLTTEINKARSSVVAYVYLFSLYPGRSQSQTTQLAEALVAAKKRGVAVRVVLYKGETSSEGKKDDIAANNRAAYDYLSAQGLNVAFGDFQQIMHAKAVIIDSATVIMGSTNWSETALTKNVETNAIIRSRDVALAMLKELCALPTASVPDHDTVAARLPVIFLKDTAFIGRMVTNRDERSFDVYLYLLKYSFSKPETTLVINYDTLAHSLGIDTTKPATYRQMIYQIFNKLRDKYKLIEYYSQLLPNVKFRIKALPGESLPIPAGYFKWGWNRHLAFTGKVMEMLNLYYSSTSYSSPKWSLTVETIAAWHGFFKEFVWTGTQDLRRKNLIDVEYFDWPENGQEQRKPNVYMPLPLYDPAALEATWLKLEAKYGKEKTDSARTYARLVFKDCDAVAVEKLIALEEQYGIDKMEKASKIISAMKTYNPKRSIEYFFGIVRKPG
jgi:cardiolipin synthase